MNKAEMIFGMHPVMEAIMAGREFDKILIQKNLKGNQLGELLTLTNKYSIPIQYVPPEKLRGITGKNHQGIIAFLSSVEFASLDNVINTAYSKGESPFLLVLDRVTDVRNFGAIVRTAECAGVHAIIIPSRGGAALNADAMKTSAGALNVVPICREPNLKNTIQYLKDSGIAIVGLTEKTNESLYSGDYIGPLAFLLGSEENGISPEYLKKCDYLASIPMKGTIGSLNVSVSAAIALYEALRQRG